MRPSILLCLVLFIISCDVEDIGYENELDPENPSFTEPQTTIKPVSSDKFNSLEIPIFIIVQKYFNF